MHPLQNVLARAPRRAQPARLSRNAANAGLFPRPRQGSARAPGSADLVPHVASSTAEQEVEEDMGDAGSSDVCYPGAVTVDNTQPDYTKILVEAADYPGLLRVMAWVLNGMGCRVHSASLRSTEGGTAHDVFYINKVGARFAADLEERLQDFVNVCKPDTEGPEPTEFSCGNIEVSNSAHPQYTQLTVVAAAHSPGLLLEMATIITGQQAAIREAVVVSAGDNPMSVGEMAFANLPQAEPGTRALRFWLTEARSGSKLDSASISALIYTIRLVMGHGKISTSPPNTDMNVSGCACSAPPTFDECA